MFGLEKGELVFFGFSLAISLAAGAISGIIAKNALLDMAAIVLGIIVGLIGCSLTFLFALIKGRLNALQDRVDIQCERGNRDFQIIADALDTIIKKLGTACAGETVKIISKRLNGLRGIITKRGLARDYGVEVIEALSESTTQFIATSVYNLADWIDPNWSTYLARQLVIVAQKKAANSSYKAKRYFMYPMDKLRYYREELEQMHECHKDSTEFIMLDKETFCTKFGSYYEKLANQEQDLADKLADISNLEQELPDLINIDDDHWVRDSLHEGALRPVEDPEEKDTLSAWLKIFEIAEEHKVPLSSLRRSTAL